MMSGVPVTELPREHLTAPVCAITAPIALLRGVPAGGDWLAHERWPSSNRGLGLVAEARQKLCNRLWIGFRIATSQYVECVGYDCSLYFSEP